MFNNYTPVDIYGHERYTAQARPQQGFISKEFLPAKKRKQSLLQI
jgi:hypothetical protein